MEMTIEKAIEWYEGLKCYTPQAKDAKNVAIETMHKYQQIEEIYKNWCYPTHINAVEAMNKLGEVLKDGKID